MQRRTRIHIRYGRSMWFIDMTIRLTRRMVANDNVMESSSEVPYGEGLPRFLSLAQRSVKGEARGAINRRVILNGNFYASLPLKYSLGKNEHGYSGAQPERTLVKKSMHLGTPFYSTLSHQLYDRLLCATSYIHLFLVARQLCNICIHRHLGGPYF